MIRENKSNSLNILILFIFTFFTVSCIVEENNSGPVKAFAYCMPGSAEINQTICLSPYGSVGESPIIEYLWDLDGDGNFGSNRENINFDLYSLEKMIRLSGPGTTTERPLFTRIIADDDWRRSYEAYIDLLLRNICNIDTIYKLAEQNFILICPISFE